MVLVVAEVPVVLLEGDEDGQEGELEVEEVLGERLDNEDQDKDLGHEELLAPSCSTVEPVESLEDLQFVPIGDHQLKED